MVLIGHSSVHIFTMGFSVLVLQSLRYVILALALKLFIVADLLDNYCAGYSNQQMRPPAGKSQGGSRLPEHGGGYYDQVGTRLDTSMPKTTTLEPIFLYAETGADASPNSSNSDRKHHNLTSGSSSCTSTSSSPQHLTLVRSWQMLSTGVRPTSPS